jgi:hypothetical protein
MSEHEHTEPEPDERSAEEQVDESGRNPTQRRIDEDGPDLSAIERSEQQRTDEPA